MTGHLSAAGTLSVPRGRDHPGSAAGPHPARFAARTRIRWENTTAVAVKIKLKRLGKIRAPYYRIVVADARTKRDGRAIEEIGKYHPKAEPSLIEVNSERAQHWLSVGAQPTDPVRKILEVTGDWQKFKGLPGAEGTLKVAAPKQDRKEIFAAAAAEALADSGATTPKGAAGAGPGPGTAPRLTPPPRRMRPRRRTRLRRRTRRPRAARRTRPTPPRRRPARTRRTARRPRRPPGPRRLRRLTHRSRTRRPRTRRPRRRSGRGQGREGRGAGQGRAGQGREGRGAGQGRAARTRRPTRRSRTRGKDRREGREG